MYIYIYILNKKYFFLFCLLFHQFINITTIIVKQIAIIAFKMIPESLTVTLGVVVLHTVHIPLELVVLQKAVCVHSPSTK